MIEQEPWRALIARLHELELPLADSGFERVLVEPPASPELRRLVTERLGGTLPTEVAELLGVTTGFRGCPNWAAHAELELRPPHSGFRALGLPGLGRLFLVFDDGNGDGLFLEPGEPVCRLWWFGHDSRSAILVARSVREYVERCARYLDEVARLERRMDQDERFNPPEPRGPYEPLSALRPISRGEALAKHPDEELQSVLEAAAPDAWVFDFRDQPCQLRAQVPGRVDWRSSRRVGEVLVLSAA